MVGDLTSLTALIGARAADQLAAAYEAALRSLSSDGFESFPNRFVRQAMVDAMMKEGRTYGYDLSLLTAIGTSTARGVLSQR